MDMFVGSDLEIALSLNEGHDFGFLNSEFGIRVSLDSNEIVTKSFVPEKLVKLDCELIFTSTKNNIKSMKIHRVPLRLDFCRFENSVLQKPFGYIILNISGAQYLPKGGNLIIKEEFHKVCGLGKEARGFNPQVLLGFRIQDIPEKEEHISSEKKNKEIPKTQSKPVEVPKPVPSDPQACGQLLPLHCYEIQLDFKHLQWLTSLKDIHLRIHHGKGEVTWSAHEEIKETIPGHVTVLENLSGKITFLAAPNDLENFLSTYPPQITVCTLRNGRPSVLGRASLTIPAVNQDVEQSVTMKNLLSVEDIGTFTYQPYLKNKGPQLLRELTNVKEELTADRFKDELKAWKEKERERLKQEFDEQLKMEKTRIESEFSEKQQKLETTLSEKIEVCRSLSEDLKKVMNEVKEKEIYLEKTKIEIEAGFQTLLADTEKETSSIRESLLNRLKEKDEMIFRLQDELSNLKINTKTKSCDISVDQIEALLEELNRLNKKLESANKQKSFFQEQWTRSIKELIRLKSEGNENILVEMKLKKSELKQLGLDHLIEKGASGDKN